MLAAAEFGRQVPQVGGRGIGVGGHWPIDQCVNSIGSRPSSRQRLAPSVPTMAWTLDTRRLDFAGPDGHPSRAAPMSSSPQNRSSEGGPATRLCAANRFLGHNDVFLWSNWAGHVGPPLGSQTPLPTKNRIRVSSGNSWRCRPSGRTRFPEAVRQPPRSVRWPAGPETGVAVGRHQERVDKGVPALPHLRVARRTGVPFVDPIDQFAQANRLAWTWHGRSPGQRNP